MHQLSRRSPSLSTDATSAPFPDALGPLRVLHQIGAGSLGPVYCAYDAKRDRVLAVKLFALTLPPDRLRQLIAEFERLIAADLGHPGILTPVVTGVAGSSPYLAHEFIEAESFAAAIRKYGPAPPESARRVITELAGCLDFAAAVDIQHGALHPPDVLILPNETRVTGLGVARALERVGVSIPVRQSYWAPERVRGHAWDRRADVYTLAALLHELLWGRRIAGSASEVAAALTAIGGADLTGLRQAFVRALADRPEERFGSALEFVEAITTAFTARSAAASEHQPTETTGSRGAALAGSAQAAASWDASSHRAAAGPDRTGMDLNLRSEERIRYADVEVAPVVPVDSSIAQPPSGAAGARPGLPNLAIPLPPPAAAVPIAATPQRLPTPARSRLFWPMAAILVIGIGVGFAVGYGVNPPRAFAPPVTSEPALPQTAAIPAAQDTPAPAATAGRDFTETVVQPPTKPAKAAADAESRTAASGGTAPAAFEGRLLVRSEPAGASVIVNGRDYGPTPAIVRGLGRGTHRVRVVRDGYIPEERNVAVTRNQPAPSVLVTLEPRRSPASQSGLRESGAGSYTGSLVVESLPPGASVYLDNKVIGHTPLTLSSVSAGEHVVRLERDGYRRWTRSVRVVAAGRNRVTASLER